MFELSDEKQKVLDTTGNLLVMGGPGSGKTTIALLKAKQIIESGALQQEQHVLFLSFARSTISRVEQHANIVLSKSISNNLEINTYHSFTWTILKSHGYLLCSKQLRLLPPHEASARLAEYDKAVDKEREINRLFEEEGLVHFDLFASMCAKLLSKSNSLSTIISETYPTIILDEFQDTNADEWAFITQLGKKSNLIVLADAEQRIYDFRGADPARIGQFIDTFHPTIFDFGNENNRSNGTDIVQFGNDLLTGKNKHQKYKNVQCVYYPIRKGIAQFILLKIAVIKACERLKCENKQGWSIAILLPSNSLMLAVSDCLERTQKLKNGTILPRIHHEVAIETAGPSIAAVLIARLIEHGSTKQCNLNQLLIDLCEHIRGRRGDKPPSKNDLALSASLVEYAISGKIRGQKRQAIIDECNEIVNRCNNLEFTGDVASDWINVRELLSDASSDCIKQVKLDATYLRLLHKGSILNSSLGEIWRRYDNYIGAAEAVKNALTQEHFATSTKTWTGVNVMTIHKAKGKEFDEVIIYEGSFPGQRFVYDEGKIDQARLNLRVAVTRAKSNTIIFTPQVNSCSLL
ncbi:UvrD-helicase domain-containing protein [Pelotomaculum propionicicum]|uniref:DNA 3'-5' helicase n=1 Tax=Pelotomaculum propionicicum TaxID=258475 RepID=A0A4Y7RC08_9FIRM|nr:ATP-dependent helicase [Pelotomaculum propionicicum]TEB06299.1 putative ATP-dependent DNA helicase YjcD [Pelotomaculum propionicicum]